jgi:adenine deaminase
MISQGSFSVSGHIVDIISKNIIVGTVTISNGKIESIREDESAQYQFILPGLIDAHIHIESSMLIPSEFARLAVIHGTVATVSDPHEIANVLGIDGVRFMINNGEKVPFKFYFGAPSCVPATPFETSGSAIRLKEIDLLLQMKEVRYLSEMMNFPGVLSGDKEVLGKLACARKYNKPVDGHAPGLRGKEVKRYIEAGISTDHESVTHEEALDKLNYGMNILIREGSAAKDFEELIDLIEIYPDRIMFCSDDKHPNDLIRGHINEQIKRAVAKGFDPVTVLKSCICNPVKHYNLDVGLLQPGDPADFIIVDNLTDFNVLETYINGLKVAEHGKSLIPHVEEEAPNHFNAVKISTRDIRVKAINNSIVIQKALDGQLWTGRSIAVPKVLSGFVSSDTDRDILKMTVVNRYIHAKPAVNFIQGFGFKSGAIASSVAHDSHNIIAVGTNDQDIAKAINMLIDCKGGIALADGREKLILPLPVAGIMSNSDGFEVARQYDILDKRAKNLGSNLSAPYMTLSFMALLVIPELKLSDKGLFNTNTFSFIDLFSKRLNK